MDNGFKPDTTVDIGMRLVIRPQSYAQVGALMDRIADLVTTALPERAAFDFTHFNTHPCKAMQLVDRERVLAQQVPMPADAEGW